MCIRASRTSLLVALVAALLFGPAAAEGSSSLTVRAAKHALRVNLARGYAIHNVTASCKRRSRVKFSCSWSGKRSGTRYRGRAVVARAGRSVTVQLSNVHRA